MLSVLTANSPWLIASASLSTQQQTQSFGLPLWLWLVVALFIIMIGVIWTLYEEGELGKKKAKTEMPAAVSTRASEAVPTPDIAMAEEADTTPTAVDQAEAVVAMEVVAPPETVPVSEVAPAAEEPKEVTPPESDLAEAAPPARPDNLKRVKGIGPKIEQLLKARGIMTFAQLADTEVSRIQAILDEADYTLADPESWPEQARQFAEA